MKKIFKNNMVMVFAIIFTVVTTIIFVSDRSNKYQNIARNGIQTTANIDYHRNSLSPSRTKYMGKSYYSVHYYFEDEDGFTHYGQTSVSFTRSEAVDIIEDGQITIKYNPATYESIQADYKKSNDARHKILIIFQIIFSAMTSLLWIAAIVVITKNIKSPKSVKTEIKGEQYTATVVGIGTDITQNGIQRYYIDYTWTDQSGRNYSNRTASDYSYEHAKLMEQTGQIKIIAKGRNSSIIENGIVSTYQKTRITPSKDFITPKKETNEPSKKNCQYCGFPLDKDSKKCPICGAKDE